MMSSSESGGFYLSVIPDARKREPESSDCCTQASLDSRLRGNDKAKKNRAPKGRGSMFYSMLSSA